MVSISSCLDRLLPFHDIERKAINVLGVFMTTRLS
jgi:hypothetical protein